MTGELKRAPISQRSTLTFLDRSGLKKNQQGAKRVDSLCKAKQPVFQNHVNRAQAIFPPHLFSLCVGSCVVCNSDLVNSAATPSKLRDKLCIYSKSILAYCQTRQ